MQYHHVNYEKLVRFCVESFKGYGFNEAQAQQITDVLLEGTYLIFVGDEENIRNAFGIKETDDNISFQPKLMSRKKQMIPTLSALWG